MSDPHAALFATDEGRHVAGFLEGIDPVFLPYSLARFRFFAERMAKAAERFRQIVVLGSGYDTRSLWLPGLAGGATTIFEVDLAETTARKAALLAVKGIFMPGTVRPVAASLDDPSLQAALTDAGFKRSVETAVFIEGALFFLAPETTRRLLDPRSLGLVRGSALTFDYWPSERTEGLNEKAVARSGRRPFGAFPFADDPYGLALALESLGYGAIAIVPLSTLAERLWLEEDPYSPHGDWRVVTAEVA